MVGFIAEPNVIDEAEEASKLKTVKELVEPFDQKLPNLSFADSFLDFDAIEGYFEDTLGREKVALWDIEEGAMDVGERSDPIGDGTDPSLGIKGESGCVVKVKNESVELEQEMVRVSLAGVSNLAIDDGSSMKSEVVGTDEKEINNGSLIDGLGLVLSNGSGDNGGIMRDEDESDSGSDEDTEKASSSPPSSSSGDGSNDDEDGESDVNESEGIVGEGNREVEILGDIEEGEIRDGTDNVIVGGTTIDEEDDEGEEDSERMVEWTDLEFDDTDEEEEGVDVIKGPIRSKNELNVLPPVPPIDVTLQPDHQVLPVGVILSIIGAQVIVEGVEKHDPLNEGSVLWITEKRCPLGLIDEIFGPVKNPYYVVRYNTESEVPAGIHVGSLISFVPEFASHVLNNKNLYTKGYDASGENDEEISNDLEFSDDEKEAEYKRMMKTSKRGMNDHGAGKKRNNRKNINNRAENWNNNKSSGKQTPTDIGPNQNQQNVPLVGASTSHFPSSGMGQNFTGAGGLDQALPQAAGVPRPSSGLWGNGVAPPQTQNAAHGGFTANNMPWSAQNQQYPYQMPLISSMPFQQQVNPSQGSHPNPGGLPNFVSGAAFSPWPAVVGQSNSNPPGFGMGFRVQHVPSNLPTNFQNQGMMLNNMHPPAVMHGDQHHNVGVGNQGLMLNSFQPPGVMPGLLFNMGFGDQGMMANNLQPRAIMPNNNQQFNMGAGNQAMMANNLQVPSGNRQFNPGASSSHGEKPHHRGGGRFGGRRGR